MEIVYTTHKKLCDLFEKIKGVDELIEVDEREIQETKSPIVYISSVRRYTKHRKQREKLYQEYLKVINFPNPL